MSGNIVVSLLLKGSLQSVWGMIRALQQIVLICLIQMPMPALLFIFFQALILIQNMDILNGNEFFGLFDFLETQPYNEHFEQFGIENLNFLQNSGSFMLFQILIPLYIILEILINRLALSYKKYQCCRNLGMSFHNKHPKRSLIHSFLKLLMESYFEIIISLALNLIAIIN